MSDTVTDKESHPKYLHLGYEDFMQASGETQSAFRLQSWIPRSQAFFWLMFCTSVSISLAWLEHNRVQCVLYGFPFLLSGMLGTFQTFRFKRFALGTILGFAAIGVTERVGLQFHRVAFELSLPIYVYFLAAFVAGFVARIVPLRG